MQPRLRIDNVKELMSRQTNILNMENIKKVSFVIVFIKELKNSGFSVHYVLWLVTILPTIVMN